MRFSRMCYKHSKKRNILQVDREKKMGLLHYCVTVPEARLPLK